MIDNRMRDLRPLKGIINIEWISLDINDVAYWNVGIGKIVKAIRLVKNDPLNGKYLLPPEAPFSDAEGGDGEGEE